MGLPDQSVLRVDADEALTLLKEAETIGRTLGLELELPEKVVHIFEKVDTSKRKQGCGVMPQTTSRSFTGAATHQPKKPCEKRCSLTPQRIPPRFYDLTPLPWNLEA